MRRRFTRAIRRPFRRLRRRLRRGRFNNRILRGRVGKSVYSFKQQAELSNINVPASTPTFFVYSFSLSQLPQVTAFENLYDNYRLLAIKITFFPEFNVSYAATASSFTLPEMYTVFDPDDVLVPTQVATLNQYQTLKRTLFTRPHVRYLKPFPALGNNSVAGTTGTANSCLLSRKMWMNMAQSGVLYYGLKGCITASQNNQIPAQTVRVSCTYYVQFRNVI